MKKPLFQAELTLHKVFFSFTKDHTMSLCEEFLQKAFGVHPNDHINLRVSFYGKDQKTKGLVKMKVIRGSDNYACFYLVQNGKKTHFPVTLRQRSHWARLGKPEVFWVGAKKMA